MSLDNQTDVTPSRPDHIEWKRSRSVTTPAGPDSVEIVRQAYAAFGRGDPDGFLGLFADDAVIEQWDGFPWGRRAVGSVQIREFAEAAGRHIRSHAQADELFVAGEDILAIGRSRGVAVATDKPFDVRIVHRWQVTDGRITLWHLFVEAQPLLTALELTNE
jgi:ketosteroid isomerase-like protein